MQFVELAFWDTAFVQCFGLALSDKLLILITSLYKLITYFITFLVFYKKRKIFLIAFHCIDFVLPGKFALKTFSVNRKHVFVSDCVTASTFASRILYCVGRTVFNVSIFIKCLLCLYKVLLLSRVLVHKIMKINCWNAWMFVFSNGFTYAVNGACQLQFYLLQWDIKSKT